MYIYSGCKQNVVVVSSCTFHYIPKNEQKWFRRKRIETELQVNSKLQHFKLPYSSEYRFPQKALIHCTIISAICLAKLETVALQVAEP